MKCFSFVVAIFAALVGAIAALVLVACEPSYAPADQLTSARVLAIQSNPVDLLPGGSTTLEALLYLPPGSPTPTYSWSWCPSASGLTTDFTCSITSAALTSALDPNGTLGVSIDYDLGTSVQADFAYPVDPNILQSLCAPTSSSQPTDASGASGASGATDTIAAMGPSTVALPCTNGGSQVSITIMLTVQVGNANLRTFRALTLYLSQPTAINTNPTVTGLAFTPSGASGALPAATPLTYGQAFSLAVSIPSTASDSYTLTLPDGTVQQRFEGLTLSWYMDTGALGRATTLIPALTDPNGVTTDIRDWTPLVTNTWTAPPASSRTSLVNFVLVLQDDRNGVGWFTQSWPLQTEAP